MFERERDGGRGNEEVCAIVITPLFSVSSLLSSFIFGKNWLSSHVLTFISIQQSKLHTVHRWKINIKLDTF